jgi:site-specific recombinase XerD
MSFLRVTLYNAMTREYINRNPAARIKLLHEENERTRVLTPFEEKKLLEKAPSWMVPIIRIATLSGLRQSEIIELRHRDIKGGQIYVSAGCKSHERREVPITPDLEPTIASLTRQMGEGRSAGHLFTDPATGQAYKRPKVADHFERAVRHAEIEDFHFHDLRRTFASRLAEKGVSLQAIADLLGHSATYVSERYAHLRPESLREAVGKLSTGVQVVEVGKNPATGPILRAVGE